MGHILGGRVLPCGISEERCPSLGPANDYIAGTGRGLLGRGGVALRSPGELLTKKPMFAPGAGAISGVTLPELKAALLGGGKRLSFGPNQQEMARLLPPPSVEDVLVVVAEGRMFYGQDMAAALAAAIHHRAHLTPEVYPTLQVVLYELLTNALEHGNLGLTQTRAQMVGVDGWYEGYLDLVKTKLATAMGSIPLVLVARRKGDLLEISIEDRGMGFKLRDLVERVKAVDTPTGRGLKLVFSLLSNKVDFTDSGRKVLFTLPTRPRAEAQMPDRSTVRQTGRLMVVDDDAVSLNLVSRNFKKAGFSHVHLVSDSKKAIEEAEAFRPDLLILDIMMPDPDGFKLCAQFKTHPVLKDVPVVFLTGAEGLPHRTKGYQLGAVDFLVKPIDPLELVVRAEVHLTNGVMMRTLRKVSDKMVADLERAQIFQRDLFPSAAMLLALCQQHDIDVAAVYQGCETLAGDYWTVLGLDESHVGVCLVDFTGHGVIAALNTVQLHTLLHRVNNPFDPVSVALELNRHLHDLLDLGSFATFMYGVLDTRDGSFSYAGCGAPPLLLLERSGKSTFLDCSGMPLGLGASVSILPRRATLTPGSTLVMVSDAVMDSPHANGERWEQEGLRDALTGLSFTSAQGLLNGLMDRFYATVQLPVPDDLTAVAITFKPDGKGKK